MRRLGGKGMRSTAAVNSGNLKVHGKVAGYFWRHGSVIPSAEHRATWEALGVSIVVLKKPACTDAKTAMRRLGGKGMRSTAAVNSGNLKVHGKVAGYFWRHGSVIPSAEHRATCETPRGGLRRRAVACPPLASATRYPDVPLAAAPPAHISASSTGRPDALPAFRPPRRAVACTPPTSATGCHASSLRDTPLRHVACRDASCPPSGLRDGPP
ncbi:hypothetical protein E2562_030342 [Oryza meyeriana var. granulata]|uniref:Uncharacterized protein n=1 Tax=Oryza meyeriana var. granulata TaxID=110450 RepID=A0A6G1D9C1_9ORYZ|nr:hypothetical protein E2562_030342 [Oryza meyeriana var. granulata]